MPSDGEGAGVPCGRVFAFDQPWPGWVGCALFNPNFEKQIMFGTIRKHQTWLWVFLVAVMSVSLVAFFTDNPFGDRSSRARGQADLGSINGRPIDPTAYLNAWK